MDDVEEQLPFEGEASSYHINRRIGIDLCREGGCDLLQTCVRISS